MEVSKQIKKYRLKMQWSQEELADKIYVTRQTIPNWETEKNYPDVHSLILLSNLFGISLDALVKGDLKQMKEQISQLEVKKFHREGIVFTILLISMTVSLVPLMVSWERSLGAFYGF